MRSKHGSVLHQNVSTAPLRRKTNANALGRPLLKRFVCWSAVRRLLIFKAANLSMRGVVLSANVKVLKKCPLRTLPAGHAMIGANEIVLPTRLSHLRPVEEIRI